MVTRAHQLRTYGVPVPGEAFAPAATTSAVLRRAMDPIAVVGVAALMPGARDTTEFWRNIVTGRDLITEVPPGRWPADGFYDPDPATPDTTYSHRGAFLPDIEFDALAHGLPPATLAAIDPRSCWA
jgi:acyl transferase domain-containing protein